MTQDQSVSKKKFRPEIEGLRAVAALLVAIYHIWLGKVSGGVDVFFVVSGFLITTSLLSKFRRTGTVNFFEFIMGLLKRLMPQAFFVLFTVIILSYFYLPGARWMQTIKEVFASALYYENWQLAFTSVDYLDAGNEKSPVQHFWAMSIQGQFYLIWFFVIWCAILLSRLFKQQIKKPLFVLLVILFSVSLGYSIYLTQVNQPWAYFDTRTRVWEFSLGGILCLMIQRIKLPSFLSAVAGWFGLIMLILCGILLEVSTMFPGYIALWPTLSAVLILLSGENRTKFGVERLLGSKWMVKIGAYSYGFYLWHWVLLTFYHVIFNNEHVSILHGCLIMAASLLLSVLVTHLIERPIRLLKARNNSWPVLFVILLCLAPVLGLNSLWQNHMHQEIEKSKALAKSNQYPGAKVFEMNDFKEKPYIPRDANIKEDQAQPYKDGCHVSSNSPEVKICEYGVTKGYDYTVAVVGGSHSTHWFTAVHDIARKHKIRLLNVTKSGCRLSTDRKGLPSCDKWNEQVVEKVSAEQPDLVLSMAEISYFDVTEVPQGYIEQFNAFTERGIEIFAVRDTPYFKKDVPECIQANGRDSALCKIEKALVVPKTTDWSKLAEKPKGVHFVDYTDKICPDDYCEPVVGNVVAYFDKSHMTKTFVSTLTPYVEKDMMPILEDIKAKRENVLSAKEDIPESYKDGCHIQDKSKTVKSCIYGKKDNYKYTVALVGDSHSAHWLGALQTISEKYPIRIVNMTKSGCSLEEKAVARPDCKAWNDSIIDKIKALNPDLVFTTAEKSYFNITTVPPGYIKQFHKLQSAGIEIFGVRDTPYFRNSVPECVAQNGAKNIKCTVPKNQVVPKTTDWSKLKEKPSNVHYYDYTQYICPKERCEPVIDGVIAYSDKGHMTQSFVKTLAPHIESNLMPLLKKTKSNKEDKK